MPASIAAWMVAILSASSAGPYTSDMPIQPSPRAETCGPFLPRVREFMMASFVKVSLANEWNYGKPGYVMSPAALSKHGRPLQAREARATTGNENSDAALHFAGR